LFLTQFTVGKVLILIFLYSYLIGSAYKILIRNPEGKPLKIIVDGSILVGILVK